MIFGLLLRLLSLTALLALFSNMATFRGPSLLLSFPTGHSNPAVISFPMLTMLSGSPSFWNRSSTLFV